MVTASKCRHPDLFWALRGGGAGFGIIVELTVRTYPSPRYITNVEYAGQVGSKDPAHLKAVGVAVYDDFDVKFGKPFLRSNPLTLSLPSPQCRFAWSTSQCCSMLSTD